MNIENTKRRTLLNGIIEQEVDGEIQYLNDLNNILLIGLEIACSEEGTNGLELMEVTKKILNTFNDRNKNEMLEILKEKNVTHIIHKMLINTDIREQLLYATNFVNLISEKIYNNNKDKINNLENKNKKLEKENSKLKNEFELRLQKAIENEIKAKEELNKFKKKHDKEIRILEHEIQNLNKKLENNN